MACLQEFVQTDCTRHVWAARSFGKGGSRLKVALTVDLKDALVSGMKIGTGRQGEQARHGQMEGRR